MGRGEGTEKREDTRIVDGELGKDRTERNVGNLLHGIGEG